MIIKVSKDKVKTLRNVKDRLENEFNINLSISNDGVVSIKLRENASVDKLMKIKTVVEALDYGFNIEDVLQLRSDDYILSLMDLRDYINKNKITHLIRIKGRIIGESGRAKRNIEELTSTKIVILEKIIALIGPYENVKAAKEAIEMLIRGKQHSTVYKWLRNWRREKMRRTQKVP